MPSPPSMFARAAGSCTPEMCGAHAELPPPPPPFPQPSLDWEVMPTLPRCRCPSKCVLPTPAKKYGMSARRAHPSSPRVGPPAKPAIHDDFVMLTPPRTPSPPGRLSVRALPVLPQGAARKPSGPSDRLKLLQKVNIAPQSQQKTLSTELEDDAHSTSRMNIQLHRSQSARNVFQPKVVDHSRTPSQSSTSHTPSPQDEDLETRQMRRSVSTPGIGRETLVSPRFHHTCPACLNLVKHSELETLGCGIHLCCTQCAAQSAKLQVRSGKLPCCFHPDCRATIEPLVALRLLEKEDHELYMQLALWSNPAVEACPLCFAMVYADTTQSNVQCPTCSHSFCLDCHCPVHSGITCEAAMQKRENQEGRKFGSLGSSSLVVSTWRQKLKNCPRCQFVVEKADMESCDHMTCVQCSHEFCWTCLADRKVIYAHGNHHHRPSCKFYAPYDGPDDYLPERCTKCARRGTACKPFALDLAMVPGAGCIPAQHIWLVDVCVQLSNMFNHGGA